MYSLFIDLASLFHQIRACTLQGDLDFGWDRDDAAWDSDLRSDDAAKVF